MRTKEELDRLRERAIALRREGKSNREIRAILGPMSNSTLTSFLRGVPPPDWTRRPNAKDELRTTARRLRNLGLDYEEIATSLGVSKSSVSLWVRDLPGRRDLASTSAGSVPPKAPADAGKPNGPPARHAWRVWQREPPPRSAT
jgi:transposase